jgi:murein DD-endopeptidase MepM/ murein hydrolase activator NlpD
MKTILISLCVFLVLIIQHVRIENKQLHDRIYYQNNYITNITTQLHYIDSTRKYVWRHLPIGSPLDLTLIRSKFGNRRDPITRRWSKHQGLDLKGTSKDTVYSTGAGIIECSGWNHGYGKCIVIDHMNGYKTLYAHLSQCLVNEGTYITDHYPIGKVGSTGRSTGAHLHYEITYSNQHKDPINFIYINLK